MNVHGDELLRLLAADGSNGCEEVDELLGMVSLGVEEIQAIFGLFDINGVLVSGVFEYELLEIEEGAFVGDFLSDLHDRSPCVCGE